MIKQVRSPMRDKNCISTIKLIIIIGKSLSFQTSYLSVFLFQKKRGATMATVSLYTMISKLGI